jgi:hypothetical protein
LSLYETLAKVLFLSLTTDLATSTMDRDLKSSLLAYTCSASTCLASYASLIFGTSTILFAIIKFKVTVGAWLTVKRVN